MDQPLKYDCPWDEHEEAHNAKSQEHHHRQQTFSQSHGQGLHTSMQLTEMSVAGDEKPPSTLETVSLDTEELDGRMGEAARLTDDKFTELA